MDGRQYLPEGFRSRYALKLLAVSLLIVAVIVAGGTVIAYQVSDRVTEEQLQSIEANAELEAESLARWFEGEQESIRLLSAHNGVNPSIDLLPRLKTQESDHRIRAVDAVRFQPALGGNRRHTGGNSRLSPS